MRRKEQEITSLEEMEEILRRCRVCRLGLSENDQPYVVPMNFGYEEKTIYFHTGPEGKKIDMLRKNDRVCFECAEDLGLVTAEKACKYSMNYRSVIGFGRASLVEGMEAKKEALNVIMHQYAGKDFDFPDEAVEKTAVIKVDIESMTGKQSG